MKMVRDICCGLLLLAVTCQGAEWSYDGNSGPAPENWPDDGQTSFCKGRSQSPIDIIDALTEEVSFEPFKFDGYNLNDFFPGTPVKVKNNGHGGYILFDDNYYLSGGGLPTPYRAAQLHFHWGADQTLGSEHEVNSETFTAELHIVHYDSSFPDLGAALAQHDGKQVLAVLGILIDASDYPNPNYEKVLSAFGKVTEDGSEAALHAVDYYNMSDLLPANTDQFYRYYGSLTTPTCNEVVIWTVFKEHVLVSQRQLDYLRNLTFINYQGQPERVLFNHRLPQPLNGRSVLYNRRSATSNSMRLTAGLTVLTIVLASIFLNL